MKKSNFVSMTAMTLLMALASFVVGAQAASKAVRVPGTVCLGHQVDAIDDPVYLASTGGSLPSFSNSVVFIREGHNRYRITVAGPSVPGATIFCEGHGQVIGSELVSTLACTNDGSQLASKPFITADIYHCTMNYKHGKVSGPGHFWWSYAYAFPTGKTGLKVGEPAFVYSPPYPPDPVNHPRGEGLYTILGHYGHWSRGACRQ